MHAESGRSLIEVIGVLAITGVMAGAGIAAYSVIHKNQIYTIANATMEQLAHDTKMLMGMRGTYEGVSVDYLIKAGALKSDAAPIGDNSWSVTAGIDGRTFSINLVNLSHGDCAYFATAIPKWASAVMINGNTDNTSAACLSSATNQVSIIVE